jgi:hypothetical protein
MRKCPIDVSELYEFIAPEGFVGLPDEDGRPLVASAAGVFLLDDVPQLDPYPSVKYLINFSEP